VRFLKLTLVILTVGAGIASANLGPGRASTRSLVNSADLIVTGRVDRVQQVRVGSVEFQGRDYTRLDFQAEISVDETIKGEPAPSRFTFSYSTPAMDSVGNVTEGGLTPNTYRVVFLKKTASGYAFVNPYFPSFPATPKSCGPNWQIELGEDPYHKVLQRALNVLCTPSSTEEKRAVLGTLNWDEDSSVAPFLKAALNLPEISSDPVLRTSLLSDLLEWKDLSVLPLAEDDLFRPSLPTEGYLKANLLLAISSLDPQIAVPLLSRALELPEPDARVGAARFLEYTKSETALESLLSALDDPDRNVRFAVMQSLGNLTGQHDWRPHTDTTESDPFWTACIEHWRQFGARRKADRTKSP
jgi:hypothetical protein